MSADAAVQAPTNGIVADEAAEAKRVPDPVAKLLAYAQVPISHARARLDRANLTRLDLGCIEAKFCN